MNVFILNAGRCGSTTFIRACRHIANYTSAHESKCMLLGEARFQYPPNHIEADNRLSWFLGRLDRHYGRDAMYVHLKRADQDVARSYTRRYSGGIMAAYRRALLMGLPKDSQPMAVTLDYCDTVSSNIELFLKDKPHRMTVALEKAKEDFPRFCAAIGAEGDIGAALAEFDVAHNAARPRTLPALVMAGRKLGRILKKLPDFVRDA